jgi:hypothetical protein
MRETPTSKLVVIAVICAVLFFLALTLLEAIPEIPVDIDFKAFFIPLAFVALLPRGALTFAVALGAALGELLRDMFEGYEIDDPIGTIGYVVGFVLAGYLIGNRPWSKARLIGAGVVSGFVHAVIEASSFLLFSKETLEIALWSAFGNTVTHGIIMGAIPLVFLLPRLHGRIERYLGFAPHKQDRLPPVPQAARLTAR